MASQVVQMPAQVWTAAQQRQEEDEKYHCEESARWRGKWRASQILDFPLYRQLRGLSASTSDIRLGTSTLACPFVKENSGYGQRSARKSVKRRPAANTVTGRCRILELPDELLLSIMEHVVPTGTTFHVFPHYFERTYTKKRAAPRSDDGTAVHCFGRPLAGSWLEESDARPAEYIATAVASVCRRFSDIFNPVFYGDNAWIFELSMHSSSPRVRGPRENGVEMASWVRLFDVRPLHIWPLTARTAKYVKDLTMLVTFSPGGGYHDVACLAGQLRRSVACFGAKHRLQSLTVDIDIDAGLRHARPSFQPSHLYTRLGWTERVDGRSRLRLQSVGERCECFRESMEEIWEALRPLRGVQDVRLSGIESEEVAEELAASIRGEESLVSSASPKQVQDEEPELVGGKRRRLR